MREVILHVTNRISGLFLCITAFFLFHPFLRVASFFSHGRHFSSQGRLSFLRVALFSQAFFSWSLFLLLRVASSYFLRVSLFFSQGKKEHWEKKKKRRPWEKRRPWVTKKEATLRKKRWPWDQRKKTRAIFVKANFFSDPFLLLNLPNNQQQQKTGNNHKMWSLCTHICRHSALMIEIKKIHT